jgi:hypothetical protein
MAGRDVYLVGSVPMADAARVFETVSGTLGRRIKRIPDGETGERGDWITWLEPVFAQSPALEKSGEIFRIHATGTARERYKLKPGRAPQDVHFDNLYYADIAKASYAVFKKLKNAGKIPAETKFQIDLVPAHSVIWLYLVDELHAPIDPIYNEAVKREIDKIAASLPHDEIAIQFDVASAVFARLERNQSSSYGRTKEEMQGTFSNILLDLGNRVPPISISCSIFVTAIPTTSMWSSRPTWATWSNSRTVSAARSGARSSSSTCRCRATATTTLTSSRCGG